MTNPGAARKIRVLILEDQDNDAELIEEELHRSGFEPEVTRAENKAAYLSALDSSVDIVLADFSLPGFDAPAALRLLQERGLDIPFILISGSVGEEAAVSIMKAGAADYLLKDRLGRLGVSVSRALEDKVRRDERRRAEAARLAAESRYRRLVEQSLAGIYIVQDGRFAYVNPKLAEMFGYTEAEMTTRTIEELVVPEDRELARNNIRRRIEGSIESIKYTLRMLRKDGAIIHVEVQGSRTELDGRPAILGMALDITERRVREKYLAVQHAVVRALAEGAPMVQTAAKILHAVRGNLGWEVGEIWTLNRTGKALRCVETGRPPGDQYEPFVKAERRLSLNRGEGIAGKVWESRNLSWIGDLSKEPGFANRETAAQAGLREAIAFPVTIGEEVLGVVVFFGSRMGDPSDELKAVFAGLGSQIAQFIKRKQVEEQFRQAQKMEAIGQLAGGIAHDFNNVLTVINGHSSMLLDREGFEPDVLEALRQVLSAGERAANLNRQLLAFSRQQEMRFEPLDLNAVVGDVGKMLRRLIGENMDLRFDYAPSLPTVLADEGMIEQVLMNLVVNARDAMSKGGRMKLSTARSTMVAGDVLRNPDARPGEFVCLTVEDTGAGIPPEILPHVFEPFFTTKEAGKGTGLGLATVFGIVKQHNGWIEVESQVGVGTVFKVLLPAAPEATVAAISKPASQTVGGGSETILLVEDEDSVRSLAIMVLQKYGYRVLEAISSDDALKVWARHSERIDLLLTDMVMPGDMTGRELGDRLKGIKPGLKVILASGYSHDNMRKHVPARDSECFLQKPYSPRALAETVRKVLDEPTKPKKEGG
jgi:two-component system cell cycle sensor histidine kinase/response regulator CckA